MKHGLSLASVIALLLVSTFGQADTMEERLRAQLRSTAQQLQQVQSQQAQMTAAKAAADAERDALKRELAALSAREKTQRSRAEKRESEQQALYAQAEAQVNDSRQQAAKLAAALQTLQQQANTLQSDGVTLKESLKERETQLAQCTVKNAQMYRAGRELLSAYEAFGKGDLLAIRQPFAGKARVEFDEHAQALGDRLYQSQVQAATVSNK
ncbi:hypothetical protein AAEY27_10350 [Kosakonia sp. BYX6]|uniref:DNA repair protein n=1 Tax=Kosakonia calanthes TaxID=3139408 RepID=A0ABZ3BAE5_9ENTR